MYCYIGYCYYVYCLQGYWHRVRLVYTYIDGLGILYIKKFTHIFFWWFSCREIVFEMCSADTVILLCISMGSHDSKMSWTIRLTDSFKYYILYDWAVIKEHSKLRTLILVSKHTHAQIYMQHRMDWADTEKQYSWLLQASLSARNNTSSLQVYYREQLPHSNVIHVSTWLVAKYLFYYIQSFASLLTGSNDYMYYHNSLWHLLCTIVVYRVIIRV